jgi:hypothetical protein
MKTKQSAPLGVKLICYIYLIEVVLYMLSLAFFLNRIVILGREANVWLSGAVRLVYVFIPFYLFFRLKRLKKDAWILAVCFQVFFLLNNSLALLEYFGCGYSLVRISGIYDPFAYTAAQVFISILNILIMLAILIYLFERRYVFLKKERH